METDYFKILALSKSLIPSLMRSPAHYLYAFETEKKQTKQMKRGSLIHVLFYKPDEFNDLYAVYDGPTSGKGSRTALDAFATEAKKDSLEIVKPDDLDEARRIVEFVRKDRYVRRLMKDARVELQFVTEHPIYGVPIKGIFDSISPEYICDLKTTTAGGPEIWKRRNLDSKTYLQIAWYRMLGILMDGIERRFVFKVIDITPPYELYLIEPDEDLIKLATKECERALQVFEKCFKAKEWPHNPTSISTWSVPNYLRNQINVD